MSIGINKDGMEEAGYAIRDNKEIEGKLKKIGQHFEKMNNHSRSIIKFEGELSSEGLKESGRIQGRLEMLKLISEEFGIELA